MFESILGSLQDFFLNVRLVDFLDIAFISLFLYLILNWLRQSVSKRTLLALTVIVFMYVTARLTEMYLTELLIEGLFVVILIGIVVVFQSDIRRLFERLGNLPLFWDEGQAPTSGSSVFTKLTEAVGRMAERNTGALIAIKGKESWDRHIHGGIGLNGQVSIPLLYSLFNPRSPGHDGAVLIEGEQILSFGAHLPLSTNLAKLSERGTRHAAALGLSEQCDALVIIVSEERGSISIARNGRLTALESGNELNQKLDEFQQEIYHPGEAALTHWWKRKNLRTALLSVGLAFIFWLAFAYQTETVYRTFSVPIEYRNLQSSHIILRDSVPLEARVTLSGPEQAFRLFEPSQLVVSFNLAGKAGADRLDITAKNLNLPSDLNLYEVTPRSLEVKARKLEPVTLPVNITTRGQLPGSLSLQSMKTEPDSVVVMTADPKENLPGSLDTEPVDLGSLKQSTSVTKALQLPEGTRLQSGTPNEVTIHIRIKNSEN